MSFRKEKGFKQLSNYRVSLTLSSFLTMGELRARTNIPYKYVSKKSQKEAEFKFHLLNMD